MLYTFGDYYTLDLARYELRQHGALVRLEPRVFDLVAYLVQHPDKTVTREELLAQLWPEQFVADDSLTYCVAQARKALGDTGQTQRYIQTVRRRGYRFIAPVTVEPPPEPDAGRPPTPATPLPTAAQPLDHAAVGAAPAPVSAALPPTASPVQATARGLGADGQDRPDAERRQLTVLFCDLVESTVLASQLDPEDYREVVRAYHQACAAVIQRFAGHIAQYLGDGLLVYFGYPQAQEDDAQRAVRTGLGLVAALGPLKARLEPVYGIRLAVRVGIHTGLAVVGALGEGERQEPLALGATPNIAARLQELAAPDTVVMSAATAQLVAGYFVCQPRGAQALKGLATPVHVYEVRHASGAQTRLDIVPPRGLTPLVGREEEVALLQRRWAQATTGQGQVVLLSGEPGIGKSRLVQVLQEHVTAAPQTCIAWRGSPWHQQSALYPVIAELSRRLGWHPDAPPAARLGTLEATLAAAGLALAEAVPLLAALLSLPLPASYPPLTLTPQRQRQRTFDLLLAWLHAEARRQPVLLVVEDLHWVDPSTLELLSLLIDQSAARRLCLVLTARAEFHPPWPLVAHLTVLPLRRLAPAQVAGIATHVAGNKALPPAVLHEVVRKTDGVPLCVEELTKMVLESGLLEEHEDHYTVHGPLPPLAIPATLHEALMARLDRLAAAKGVAQLGATIGQTFAYDLLQAVVPLEAASLQDALGRLVAAEVVTQRGVPPQATYTFKHALLQEAAYQSLLRSTRQQYHQHIAQVVETRFPELVAGQPELLAHHALGGEMWEKAVSYFQQAGARACDRAAFHEAVAYFDQALQALAYLHEHDDTRVMAIDLRLDLRSALLPSGNSERILAALHEARPLAEALNDPHRLGQVSNFLCVSFRRLGLYDQAILAGQRALALATASGDVALHALANDSLGTAYMAQGNYVRAVDCFRQTIASIKREWHHKRLGQVFLPAVHARAHLAACQAELGVFAEGSVLGEEGLQMAEERAHTASLMIASWGRGFLALRQGDVAKALSRLEVAIGIAQETEILASFPLIAACLGMTYTLSGHIANALPLLRQAMAQMISLERMDLQALCRLALGEAQMVAGRLDEAYTQAQRALEFSHAHQERGNEAYALRLLGNIAAQRDPLEIVPAEVHYHQALSLAEELGMRPLQAHCHRGLGTLYAKRGRVEQARLELVTALELYRAMAMTFWLPQVEAVLAQVEGG